MLQLLHLPDGIIAQLLAQLPRDAQLRMRLLSQLFCSRITAILSDVWLGRCARFDRKFRVPAALNSFPDEAPFLARLCRRFRVDNQNWALQIRISACNPALTFGELCCVYLAAEFEERLAIELLPSGPVANTPANKQLIDDGQAVARRPRLVASTPENRQRIDDGHCLFGWTWDPTKLSARQRGFHD
jgi:hypothetical protein